MTAYGYPLVSEVKPLDNYRLLLTFDNNEIRVFDASQMLTGMEGKWLGELLDKDYFASVYVNSGIVTWPDEQDICPDCIYEDSVPVTN